MGVRKYFIILGFFTFYHSMASEYYCPHSNVVFEQEEDSGRGTLTPKHFLLGADVFPKSQIVTEKNYIRMKQIFKYSDCSNEEFYCKHFFQFDEYKKISEFSLILPKVLTLGKEYDFNGIRAVTREAKISASLIGDNTVPPIVQIVLWQKVNGKNIPIKLTVEEGKGVTYLDGIDLTGSSFKYGEVCNLLSNDGFFSNIKVNKKDTHFIPSE